MSTNNAHLLVVDDNEDILFMLKTMFQLKGYKVSVKDNAEDIEYYLQQLSPDVILMDMLLSGADGRELCKLIKSNPLISSIPIVMISAMPNADQMCKDAGADYFIGKPFEMEHMLSTVANAILVREK